MTKEQWIKDYFEDRGTYLIAQGPRFVIEEMFAAAFMAGREAREDPKVAPVDEGSPN